MSLDMCWSLDSSRRVNLKLSLQCGSIGRSERREETLLSIEPPCNSLALRRQMRVKLQKTELEKI